MRFAVAVIAIASGCAPPHAEPPPPLAALVPVADAATVGARFDAAAGRPRVVALLSPS